MTCTPGETELLEFLYACPVGLIQCNALGDIRMINPHAMQHLLPLAGTRDPGNLFTALEQHAPEIRHLASSFTRSTGKVFEGHRIAVDLGSGRCAGDPKILACTLIKLGHDRLMATLVDISAQVAKEQRLRQTETWFATLLDQINDYAVITLSANGEIETANESLTRQTGYDHTAVVGRPLVAVLGHALSRDDLGIDGQLALAARDGWHLHEGWQSRASGERYWCQRLIVARIEGGAVKPTSFCVVLRDVPRRGAVADDLRRLLTCDHLTGAANRLQFSRMLECARQQWQEIRQPLSLVTLDLDHFKSVNDTHGHPVGDILLCAVSDTCSKLVPSYATFARIGGEEFGLLLPRHDTWRAIRLAETIRAAIAEIEIPAPSAVLRATASFGCASLDETDGSIDALIALADQRLYAAKRDGRNRVYRPQACEI